MADDPVTAWIEPGRERSRGGWPGTVPALPPPPLAVLAGVLGLFAVLIVQTAANAELIRSRAAVQARYELAVEAIKTFHSGVSEDFLLKEEKFKDLRDRLLNSASDFYGKKASRLAGQGNRRPLAAISCAIEL